MKRLTLLVLAGIALAVGSAIGWPSAVFAGPTAAQKCEAFKLKHTGKYAACRLKAEAKAVKKGESPDYSKCNEKVGDKFDKAESKWGAECPTSGDVAGIEGQVTADADFVALKLAGVRFVDNGDGTVTDVDTELMWEQKDGNDGVANPSDPHDVDNTYTWCVDVVPYDYVCDNNDGAPDGTAFTSFLGALNGGTMPHDLLGLRVSGCFAGHCDWRLPTVVELAAIRLPYPCTSPCIDAALGPTESSPYWSSTTLSPNFDLAWFVSFDDGFVGVAYKSQVNPFYVRAVRGGS